MVCIRCVMVVKAELTKLNLPYTSVELGQAEITGDISGVQRQQIGEALLSAGLELMDDKKSVLIEKIKSVIIEMVHYSEEPLIVKFSEYLSQKLHHDYTTIRNFFA